MASEKCNLHPAKMHMLLISTDFDGIVGDEYDHEKKEWVPRPENYPAESDADRKEKKIQNEIRQMAIDRLKDSGDEDFQTKETGK